MVADNVTPDPKHAKALLVGLGLDNDDGHVRVTRGHNFHLQGGSQQTHEKMQEQAIKFNEKLTDRGRQLEEISRCRPFCVLSKRVTTVTCPVKNGWYIYTAL